MAKWKRFPLKNDSNHRGQIAEQVACEYLLREGLQHVTSNFRCKMGEIDLIMRERNCWVFVEVKYRTSQAYGQANEYFHMHKRRKFLKAIQYFFINQRINSEMAEQRIDVIAIDKDQIQWFKSV